MLRLLRFGAGVPEINGMIVISLSPFLSSADSTKSKLFAREACCHPSRGVFTLPFFLPTVPPSVQGNRHWLSAELQESSLCQPCLCVWWAFLLRPADGGRGTGAEVH